MRRGLIILVVLLLTGGATLLAARLASLLPSLSSDPEQTAESGKSDTKPAATAGSGLPGDNAAKYGTATVGQQVVTLSEAQLDISRISPSGSSVFAGRAEPNTYVTVYENSTPVGSVKADENGEWSLVTEHRFASLDPKLTFKSAAAPPPVADAKPAEVAANTDAGKPLGANASPEAVAKNLMSGFEKLVAQAREEAKTEEAKPKAVTEESIPTVDVPAAAPLTSPSASSPPAAEVKVSEAPKSQVAEAKPKSGTAETAPASQVAAADSATTAKPAPAPESASIPVPIMFVYNEASFTSEGRRAADLLLEYLRLKHLQSISLSGHADERGSDPYNMDLSRERLDAVARYLREGGFSGKLDLVPKGKSEPFSGIDRSKFSGEALYQLDRRVELRVYR